MDDTKKEKVVKKVSLLGIAANLLLLCIKLAIGFLSKSQAMIADGVNSAGDIFASTVSYVGAKMSSKPKDEEHPYGHGKTEYICTVLISVSMVVASVVMLNTSILSIINQEKLVFSFWLVIVACITIVTKFLLYLYTNSKYKKYNNILLRANKEDHRNDMFLTTGTLLGIIASYCGFYFVDGIVGSLISLWIAFAGVKLFRTAYMVLIDTSIDKEKQNQIIDEVNNFKDVLHVDSVNSKPAGFKHVIVLKVSMDGNKSLFEGHKIGGEIKDKLIQKYDYILDVIVHINPH